jgi:hypothetical protein
MVWFFSNFPPFVQWTVSFTWKKRVHEDTHKDEVSGVETGQV